MVAFHMRPLQSCRVSGNSTLPSKISVRPACLKQPTLATTGKGRERLPKASALTLLNSPPVARFWRSGFHLSTNFRLSALVTKREIPAHFRRPRTFTLSISSVIRLHRGEFHPKSLKPLSILRRASPKIGRAHV